MITKEQIDELAKYYQIDQFTIFREYLQLLFLSYFYRHPKTGKVYFKGGTAIRLLFDSPRFSEDLDFSTTYSPQEIKKMVKETETLLQKELPELTIAVMYVGKDGLRYRIKYQPFFLKYPLTVRLDFNRAKKIGKTAVSPIITKFPLTAFPLVSSLSSKEILNEKIQALVNRDKGRDFFDVWLLLEKGIKIDKKLVTKKLLKKMATFSQAKLDRDLGRFLPFFQKKITALLKDLLLKKLQSNYDPGL